MAGLIDSTITTAANAARTAAPSSKQVPGAQGVFSAFPMATAKFAHYFDRNGDYTDTMARMYLEVGPKEFDKFINGIPDKETQRILQVLAVTGSETGGRGYIDFLLQGVQPAFQENMQVSETLADNYVAYFFGQAPPVFQFSGTLMNTYQDDWAMRMFRIYRDIGRGSQLARQKKLLTITFDAITLRGAMTNLFWGHTADLQTACSFSFGFLVKELRIDEDKNGLASPSRPTSLGNVGGEAAAVPGAPTATTTALGTTGVNPQGAATTAPTLERSAMYAAQAGVPQSTIMGSQAGYYAETSPEEALAMLQGWEPPGATGTSATGTEVTQATMPESKGGTSNTWPRPQRSRR